MKMAVVGCEASGKTVFMCAMADYYGRDAATNPMRLKLTPENAEANKFERFQFRQMRCQRQWPPATPPNRTIEIKWSLRHNGEALATIDLLEFGGETYRAAFRDTQKTEHEGSVAELLKYLGDTDFFVVLVSLKALIASADASSDEDFDRETEALWVTRGILEFIRKNRPDAGVVIGLTQADRYRNELGDAGSPKAFFATHWPTVASAIGNIPVVEVASVSKTDEDGNPAEGYHTHGILPVMRIFAQHCFGSEEALEKGTIDLRLAADATAKGSARKHLPPSNIPAPSADIPAITNPLSGARATVKAANATTAGKPSRARILPLFFLLPLLAAAVAIWGVSRHNAGPSKTEIPSSEPVIVTNTIEKAVEKIIKTEVPVTNTVEKIVRVAVTNMVEKIVKVPVTNMVEKIVKVQVPVTNTVEKIVKTEVPVTNTVEKVVKVAVTNMVEKVVRVPVTNTVEKVVKVERVVTNVVEKIVEKPVSAGPVLNNMPAVTTVSAPTNAVLTDAELQKQVPPGYRIWTDYNGRKIIARWTGVAVDESGITLITRYNRRIDAVLWKFSPEDQQYIKSEIKRHADKGELMSEGKWIRNPLFKAN